MKNTFKIAKYLVLAAFLFFVCNDNLNAAPTVNNCSALNTATFNFTVEPAIGITTKDVELPPLCPGCRRDWLCDQSPYFMQFDVKGSINCQYKWDPNGGIQQSVGDMHGTLYGCWYYLAPDGTTWLPWGGQFVYSFINQSGQGIGGFRYYINHQGADCQASGSYAWKLKVTVDYVCSTMGS